MKLRAIISNLISSKDSDSHEFVRLWNLGVFGMQTEFNLDVKGVYKSILLDVNPNFTCELPCDYVSYNKLGIVNLNGEVVTFKRNDRLSNYHASYFINTSRNANVPTLPTYGVIGGLNSGLADYNAFSYLNYWYNGSQYNLLGLPSGTADIGQYKIDETNRIILFSPQFQWTSFLLEYLSDGVDEDDDYEVDVRMAEAVKCYLRWQDVADRPKKASPGAVAQLRSQYYNAKRLARCRINPIVLNEMQNAERRSWKLVPKA